jgi:hypothetical protein
MKKVLVFAALVTAFAACSDAVSTDETGTATDTTIVKSLDSTTVAPVDSVK